MIRIEHLSKHYGERVVVKDLNLHVEAGQVYALLGPNGAGKSTTIGCLLGFVKPDAGRITLAGSPLMPAEAAIRYAAYIAENVALYDRLTGVENVDFFMRLLGRRLKTSEIETLLERVGLPRHAWHRRAHGYSKGMRQKVGIVMALAKGARVLVLDEPTSGLDPEASLSFGNLIRTVADDGAAVIMATHDLLRAQELADRCGVLVGGHLVSEWKLRDLGAGELERNYLDSLAARVSTNG